MLDKLLETCQLDRLFLDLHNFLVMHPSSVWRQRPNNIPLRSIKTIIHHVAEKVGPRVRDWLKVCACVRYRYSICLILSSHFLLANLPKFCFYLIFFRSLPRALVSFQLMDHLSLVSNSDESELVLFLQKRLAMGGAAAASAATKAEVPSSVPMARTAVRILILCTCHCVVSVLYWCKRMVLVVV